MEFKVQCTWELDVSSGGKHCMGMKLHTKGGSHQSLLVAAAAHHGAVVLARRPRSPSHPRRKELCGVTLPSPSSALKILRRVWRVKIQFLPN
jgi:hypothetical protein